jgi:hypothetical protein
MISGKRCSNESVEFVTAEREPLKIAILDEYQKVALSMADWSTLGGRAAITVFNDHVADPDAVVTRLRPFEIVCAMRERTPMTRAIIERLPNLRELGFEDVIDLTSEGLAEGVRRITAGKGVDIVVESIGGSVTSEALSSPALGGVLITLGYSAGRKTTIDVTDLIWKRARMAGFSLFAQSPTAIAAARREVIRLMVTGSVKPIVEWVYPFSEAGEALRHLIEDRPFGKVVLNG